MQRDFFCCKKETIKFPPIRRGRLEESFTVALGLAAQLRVEWCGDVQSFVKLGHNGPLLGSGMRGSLPMTGHSGGKTLER